MYSGITRGLFAVTNVDKKPGLLVYSVKLNDELLKGLEIGASVAIDGVCQSVVKINNKEVTFQAIEQTLKLTTLNDLRTGQLVSVENSLRYGDVIGGHEIAGHVIGTALVVQINSTENNLMLVLQCPNDWLKYIFIKGYIAVDGSSLTVAEKNEQNSTFTVHLIPETIRLTHLGNKKVGDRVNIELDFKTQAIVSTFERFLREQEKAAD